MTGANQTDNECLLRAAGVSRIYGKGDAAVHALRKMDLHIPKGKLVALKGRSGSGKTTLLNLLGALDRPTEGMVLIDGENIADWSERRRDEYKRRNMGFVFQSFGLFPYMSAYENIEFGMRVAGITGEDRTRTICEALDLVGLLDRAKHRPFEMSGGEQQRVAIARAFAHRPPLMLADEPTAELDSRMAIRVVMVFKELVRQGMTIVMTTHDQAILELVDETYSLEAGWGVQEQ